MRHIPQSLEGYDESDELRGTDFRKTFADMAYLLDEPTEDKDSD